MGDVSCNKGATPLHLAAMKVGRTSTREAGARARGQRERLPAHVRPAQLCRAACTYNAQGAVRKPPPHAAPLLPGILQPPPAPAAPQGDVATACLLLRAHSKLAELTPPAERRCLRDPRRAPDGYGKTAYTVAFDLGRWAALGRAQGGWG